MTEWLSLIPDSGIARFLFDAVWQSTVIGVCFLFAIRCVARRPSARAWLAVLGCAICVCVPAGSAAVRWFEYGILPAASVVDAESQPMIRNASTRNASTRNASTRNASIRKVEIDGPGFEQTDHGTSVEGERKSVHETGPPVVSTVPLPAQSDTSDTSLSQPLTEPYRISKFVFPVVCFVWAGLFSILVARLCFGFISLQRLAGNARVCEDPVLVSAIRSAARLLKLPRVPGLFVSNETSCPAAITWPRPRILVPDVTSDPDANRWLGIFAHEIAHIRRGDGWSNLVTEFAYAIFPWNPAIRSLRRAFQEYSEQACDDWAVYAGADPIDFAETLTGWIPRKQPTLAPGISGWPIRRRIERLLECRIPGKPSLSLVTRIATLVLASLLLVVVSVTQSGARTERMGHSVETVAASSETQQAKSSIVFGDGRLAHWNTAWVIGFDRIAERVVSKSKDGTLIGWDIASGRPAFKRNLPPRVSGKWREWSSDAKQKFSVCETMTPDAKRLIQCMANGHVRVVDLSTGDFETVAVNCQDAVDLKVSHDQSTLVILRQATDAAAELQVFDLADWKRQYSLAVSGDLTTRRWQGLAINAKGSDIALGNHEAVVVLDANSGEITRRESFAKRIGCSPAILEFAPDGSCLICPGGVLSLRNAAALRSLARFQAADSGVRTSVSCVAFSPDSRWLFLARASSVSAWSLPDGKMQWVRSPNVEKRITSICAANDGSRIAVGVDNEILVLDSLSGRPSDVHQSVNRIQAVTAHPHQPVALLGMDSGEIQSLSLASDRAITKEFSLHDSVEHIQYSPDGRHVAALSGESLFVADGNPEDWKSLKSPTTRGRFRRTPPQRPARFRPLAFSADSRFVVSFPDPSSRARNELSRWNAASGESADALTMKEMILPYYGLTPLSENEWLVLSLGAREDLSLVDAHSGETRATLPRIFPKLGGRLIVDTKRNRVAYGMRGEAFRVYSRQTGSWMDFKKGHARGTLHCLAFHPDRSVLASAAEDGRVVLWNLQTGQVISKLTVGPPGGRIHGLAWSSDGRSVLSRHGNGTATLRSIDEVLANLPDAFAASR